jgi:serine/threonine protein phosphatase PrpC
MRYSVVSSAGSGSVNEDLVMVREGNGVTDIIVMDGATPLTPQRWIGAGASDPAWFVRQFAADLCALLQMDGSQDSLVRQALGATRDAWRRHARGNPPPYAWPVATLSWVRVRAGRLELYCLGDSKILLAGPDGGVADLDPFDNSMEREVQATVAALVRDGVDDPAARWELLLPMLRERRHAQNTAARPQVLCLDPQGAFDARTLTHAAPPDALLLLMSDGFYRLVDTYGLYDDAGLAAACVERGLDALVDQLRRHEAGAAATTAKHADDASAVAWRLS